MIDEISKDMGFSYQWVAYDWLSEQTFEDPSTRYPGLFQEGKIDAVVSLLPTNPSIIMYHSPHI